MRTVSYLAFLIFLSSCSLFDDPGSEVILNVDNEFEVEIKEHLIPDGRELQFMMKAVNDVMCEDSELILETDKGGGFINIKISDIIMTTECASGRSFPSGDAFFGLRSSTYDLIIQVKDQVSQEGFLEVSDKEYFINMADAKGLILKTDYLKRIPNNFAWGYYDSSNERDLQTIENFLKDNNLINRPLSDLDPGFYSYFSIDDMGNIDIEETSNLSKAKMVAFDNINLEEVKTKITQFKGEYPQIKLTFNFSDGAIL